jgi:hypothetical protein
MGIEIFYLVEGTDLAGLKDDSLQVSSLRGRDGSDLSVTRTGTATVTLGPFPATTDDGRHLFFSLRSQEDLFGRVDERSLRGSVVVFTGSRRETGELTITATTPPQVVGPFRVSPAPGVSAGDVGVTVTGPLPALINVLQIRGVAIVTAEQTSSDGTEKTFLFPPGGGASARIRLHYWTELSERTVRFGS